MPSTLPTITSAAPHWTASALDEARVGFAQRGDRRLQQRLHALDLGVLRVALGGPAELGHDDRADVLARALEAVRGSADRVRVAGLAPAAELRERVGSRAREDVDQLLDQVAVLLGHAPYPLAVDQRLLSCQPARQER